jgi:MFS family permease
MSEKLSEIDEKQQRHHHDAAGLSPINTKEENILNEFTPEETKKIIHRIDRRLITTVGLMYCISLMDRTNLSVAAIAGMNVDLALTAHFRYNIVTVVFFATYVVFQFPSTIVIRYLGPRNHLAGITLAWGVVMIGMGFVKNFGQLAALRVILGILEAGFFPGSVYLLSTWYSRYDMHKRYSVFYFIGSMASALAGILAFGLSQMKGLQGLNGWRWIFIIEGVLTCVIAIMGYFLLVGFPDDKHRNWRFLNDRETELIIARVNKDRGDAHTEKFNLKKFLGAASDMKIWGFAWIFGMTTTVTYALAFFLPLILRNGMGFSVGAAQCLVAPPYFCAGLLMYATAWAGDKYHIRGPIIIFNSVLAIIGIPLIGWVENVGVRYFGVFLICMGANSNIPASMAYQANNIRGHWKRAFCSATLVGAGGVGGVIGSLVFREQDAKTGYRPGLYACIASQLIIILVVIALSFKFTRDNKASERGELEIEGSEAGFKYTL